MTTQSANWNSLNSKQVDRVLERYRLWDETAYAGLIGVVLTKNLLEGKSIEGKGNLTKLVVTSYEDDELDHLGFGGSGDALVLGFDVFLRNIETNEIIQLTKQVLTNMDMLSSVRKYNMYHDKIITSVYDFSNYPIEFDDNYEITFLCPSGETTDIVLDNFDVVVHYNYKLSA